MLMNLMCLAANGDTDVGVVERSDVVLFRYESKKGFVTL